MDDYDDVHRSPAAKRSRAKTAAERTAEWRAANREIGRPEVKAVDTAMSEASSYLASLCRAGQTFIDIEQLVEVTTVVLVREGYKRWHAKACVIERLKPRPRHDVMSTMPSRQPHFTEALIQPPDGATQWRQEDIDYIRKLAGAARR